MNHIKRISYFHARSKYKHNRTTLTSAPGCHLNRGYNEHGDETRSNVANDDSSSCDSADYGYGPGEDGVEGRGEIEGFGGTLTIR